MYDGQRERGRWSEDISLTFCVKFFAERRKVSKD